MSDTEPTDPVIDIELEERAASNMIELRWRGATYFFEDAEGIVINEVVWLFPPRHEPGYVRAHWTAAIGEEATGFVLDVTGQTAQAALDALEQELLVVYPQIARALGVP